MDNLYDGAATKSGVSLFVGAGALMGMLVVLSEERVHASRELYDLGNSALRYCVWAQ